MAFMVPKVNVNGIELFFSYICMILLLRKNRLDPDKYEKINLEKNGVKM